MNILSLLTPKNTVNDQFMSAKEANELTKRVDLKEARLETSLASVRFRIRAATESGKFQISYPIHSDEHDENAAVISYLVDKGYSVEVNNSDVPTLIICWADFA